MATKKKDTKVIKSSGPSASLLKLLESKRAGKTQRLTMPTMIKPAQIPIGQQISGKLLAVVNSMKKSIKGKLLHMRHESGEEFTFPATGVISNALAPGLKNEDPAYVKELEKFKGKTLFFKRADDQMSGAYKKPMFMFDVEVSES